MPASPQNDIASDGHFDVVYLEFFSLQHRTLKMSLETGACLELFRSPKQKGIEIRSEFRALLNPSLQTFLTQKASPS
jgi:hypothetical protein